MMKKAKTPQLARLNNFRTLVRQTLVVLGLVFLICACGVKGDPVPPGTPAELGRGRPTYKKAAEDFRMKKIPRVYSDEDDDEDDDEEDKDEDESSR